MHEQISPTVEFADLPKVLKESDFITIHVPALPATKGMINADAIAPFATRITELLHIHAVDLFAALEVGHDFLDGHLGAVILGLGGGGAQMRDDDSN